MLAMEVTKFTHQRWKLHQLREAGSDTSISVVVFYVWELDNNNGWIMWVYILYLEKKIEVLFSSQTRAKINQLKLQLKNVKKTGTINEYFLAIKIVDMLAVVGAKINMIFLKKISFYIWFFYHIGNESLCCWLKMNDLKSIRKI